MGITYKKLGPAPPAPPAPSALFNEIINNSKKDIPKAESTMKPLHINKIPNKIRNETIWKNVDDSQYYSKIDFKSIEEAFSISNDDNLALAQQKSNSLLHVSNEPDSLYSLTTQTNPKTIFADPVRAISATVARRRLPSADELIEIIETMDPNNKLGEAEISNLLQLILTPEEKASLYSCYLPQMDELHNCLYKISKIMYYNDKLEIIKFKTSLKEKFNSKFELNNVKQCCSILKENKNILKLFELLLCIVNYVNQSNQNGNAFGFKINFLNKLNEIKSNNRGLTLMHHLVMIIKQKYPDLLKIPEELDVVKKVAIFNIIEFNNDIINLDLKMKKINDLMDRIKKDTINFDKNIKFYQAMKIFYEDNKKKIEALKIEYNEAVNQYSNVSKYFGENGSAENFNEFFIIWSTFIKTFATIRNQLEQETIKLNKMPSSSHFQKHETKKTNGIRKRIVNEIELSSVLNSDDFAKVCLEVQTGEIFNANKAIKRVIRNRTKSSNLNKGEISRSRSPSVS